MSTYTLVVHCPQVQVSSERSYTSDQTIASFKSRLETLTGIPPSHQVIEIYTSRTDDADASPRLIRKLPVNGTEDESIKLHDVGVDQDGLGIKVTDDRPEDITRMYTDETLLKERFELTEEEYKNRSDTVLAYKQRNKLGRFDPAQQAAQEAISQASSNQDAVTIAKWLDNVNKRFETLDTTARRGTIRFVGNTSFAQGVWIGVEFDEPVGKNDGSVNGIRYFQCRDKFGGFVKPDKIQVGEFPVRSIEDELDLDEDEI
ncbi:unnamed protein product [Sympodiomycopsis kandeliae]